MRYGSLFSGIGGIDLGLDRAGMECAFQVELDPYCRKVLARHWPSVPRYEDVRDVGAHNLEPVDLICGGFPCQDISVAGKGAGIDGSRSGLWGEFRRLVRDLRPDWVLVENVGALAFRGLGRVLGDLAALGYDAEWDSIPAALFGAPHRRERLFIAAHANGERLQDTPFGPAAVRQFERATPTPFRLPEPPEPPVCRVDDGIPHRVDRLRALGNAVVPQVAEWIGCRIMAAQ